MAERKKDNRTNNDLQNMHIKLKMEFHEPYYVSYSYKFVMALPKSDTNFISCCWCNEGTRGLFIIFDTADVNAGGRGCATIHWSTAATIKLNKSSLNAIFLISEI